MYSFLLQPPFYGKSEGPGYCHVATLPSRFAKAC